MSYMVIIVGTAELEARIRVAVIIEGGRIIPVWFELTDKPSRERVFVKKITYRWTHMEGTAKILNIGIWDGANSYCLSLNTKEFTWRLGIAEESPFPASSGTSTWRFHRDED